MELDKKEDKFNPFSNISEISEVFERKVIMSQQSILIPK